MMPANGDSFGFNGIDSAMVDSGAPPRSNSSSASARGSRVDRMLMAILMAILTVLALQAGPLLALSEDDGFRPEPNSIVHTLTSTSFGTLVGGNFTAIAGESRGKWAMLDAAGGKTSFGQISLTSGVVFAGLETSDANGAAEIVLAGSFGNHILRLNALGEPATAWSNPSVDGTIRALAEAPVTSGGPGVYIGGEFSTVNGQTRRRVALIESDGQHSTGFLPPNFTGTLHALAVQADGKVLVGGSLGIVLAPQRLYRLNPDGSLDTSFQPVSMSTGNRTVYAIEVEDDGRILVAGALDGDGFIVRLNPDGSVDNTYEPPSLNGPVYALDLLPDGRALIGGDFTSGVGLRSRIARLNENGSVDNGFGFFVNPNGPVRTLLVQDDGSVLIGGGFNQIGNFGRSHLARLDARGRIDQSLAATLGNEQGPIHAIAMQGDGQILVGGDFTEINGSSRSHLARLNPNGSLDSSFAPIINGRVSAIAVQRDGRILIGGRFSFFPNSQICGHLARLHPDGSLDESFCVSIDNLGSMLGGAYVNALHLYDDGRILVGGQFRQFASGTRHGLARLLPDGTVDPSFAPNWQSSENSLTGAGNTINHFTLDEDGWIYAVGLVVAPGNGPQRIVARLSPSGQQSEEFSPGLGPSSSSYMADAIELLDNLLAVGGKIRYRQSALGPLRYAWSIIDLAGDHTLSSPFFQDDRLLTMNKRGSGLFVGGRFTVDGTTMRLGLMNSGGTALQADVQPIPEPSGRSVTAAHLSPDGRVLTAVGRYPVAEAFNVLERIANPDGLPLRQRIVWGTPGNPERLVWDRMTGFSSAPAVLGTPRVLVSQTCCDADDFEPAAGGGWMSRDGDDWRLEGFDGLPGKFYVRIEYRAGNSRNSSTFLTPIQRLYGEIPPGVDTADLSLKLVIDQDPVEPGDVAMVDVLASNAGPDLAGLPSVTIDLPAGYTLIDFDDSDQGTFLPDEMLWKLDDLAGSGPGADAQLRLQLQVTQQTPYTIEAQIFAGEFDPDVNNNVAALTPNVLRNRSDLKLAHSVVPAAGVPGDMVTFTVLADNLGPEPADGVEVAHLLPTGYSYQSHNNSQGSYNSATGQWQIGGLDVGEGAVLEVAALVNSAGGFTSSASASSFSEDPEPLNNLAFAEVDPFTDLAVSIEADAEWAGMGDALAMIVQVVNDGPREAPAASVQVQPLSGGFVPFEHFASIGDYEPNSGLWTLGPLAPGARATLVIDGTPGLQMDTELAATVSSAAFDLDPSNDTASTLVRYQFDGPFGQFSPASIDFGEVLVGQSSDSVVITVTSVGDEPLDMGFTNTDGEHQDDFVFDGGTCIASAPPLEVGETCIVSLRFVPEAQGLRTAEVLINANDPNAPFTIPITGTGLSDTVEDAIFSDRFQGFQ